MERSLRPKQFVPKGRCERMLATEHAPRDPFRVFERRHGFAEVVECGAGVLRDVHEAVAILEDVLRTTRRVFGTSHPNFIEYREDLESARMRLADDESRAADA